MTRVPTVVRDDVRTTRIAQAAHARGGREYVAFSSLSVEGNDFYVGAGMVIAALLQDPEFLYRIERGEPVKGRKGLYRLDDYEVGTRLSYFIWGSTPDDELLDTASKGALRTPEQVRAAAERLLADPRARTRIDRFHAMWLGYYKLPHSAELVASMRTETQKLLKRVVFEEGRPWTIRSRRPRHISTRTSRSYTACQRQAAVPAGQRTAGPAIARACCRPARFSRSPESSAIPARPSAAS